MIYEWRCKGAGCYRQMDVTRSVDDHRVPPTPEEIAAEAGNLLACEHEWVRVYTASTPFEHLKDQGVFERTQWPRGQ
jgi:hypothetical protein